MRKFKRFLRWSIIPAIILQIVILISKSNITEDDVVLSFVLSVMFLGIPSLFFSVKNSSKNKTNSSSSSTQSSLFSYSLVRGCKKYTEKEVARLLYDNNIYACRLDYGGPIAETEFVEPVLRAYINTSSMRVHLEGYKVDYDLKHGSSSFFRGGVMWVTDGSDEYWYLLDSEKRLILY